MSWYDVFASVYDLAIERIYAPYRRELAAALQPDACGTVLDLACGTGQNFSFLLERLSPTGWLIGLDASAGMLERARRRAERHGWRRIRLLHQDARSLDRSALPHPTGEAVPIDAVVCALGLSVIPEWQRVFHAAFDLLRPGGQMLIFDVYAERRVPQTWLVERVARADLRRKTWEPLEQLSDAFELRFLPGSPHVHGGRLFLASGLKPA